MVQGAQAAQSGAGALNSVADPEPVQEKHSPRSQSHRGAQLIDACRKVQLFSHAG